MLTASFKYQILKDLITNTFRNEIYSAYCLRYQFSNILMSIHEYVNKAICRFKHKYKELPLSNNLIVTGPFYTNK